MRSTAGTATRGRPRRTLADMDTELPATPTLAAVRLARAQRDAVMRRLRPVGLIILAIVLVVGVPPAAASRPARRAAGGPARAGSRSRSAGWPRCGCPGPPAARWCCRSLSLAGRVDSSLAWLQPRGTAGSLGFLVVGAGGDEGAAGPARPARSVAAGRGRDRRHPGAGRGRGARARAHARRGQRADRDPARVRGGGRGADPAAGPGQLPDRAAAGRPRARAQDAEVRAAALAERQRLAREMHDVLAHSLSGLALQLEGARLLAIEDSADAAADRRHRARPPSGQVRAAGGAAGDRHAPRR